MATIETAAIPARVAAAYPAMVPTPGPLSALAEAEGSAVDELETSLEALVVRVTVNWTSLAVLTAATVLASANVVAAAGGVVGTVVMAVVEVLGTTAWVVVAVVEVVASLVVASLFGVGWAAVVSGVV
jgi:hypothetical protein